MSTSRESAGPAAADAPALFPAFLKLRDRRVLVVGGGAVAEAKLQGLLAAGARVTVVAPELRPGIVAAGVPFVRRGFRPSDVQGAWLVIAAAPPEVNREVLAAAEARGVYVNAVDDPANGSVYLGGVLRRGGVTIAVSTDGKAPALAGLLREALEAALPEDIEDWVAAAQALRAEQKRSRVAIGERRPLLLLALNRLYGQRQEAASEPDSLGPSERGGAGGAAQHPLQEVVS